MAYTRSLDDNRVWWKWSWWLKLELHVSLNGKLNCYSTIRSKIRWQYFQKLTEIKIFNDVHRGLGWCRMDNTCNLSIPWLCGMHVLRQNCSVSYGPWNYWHDVAYLPRVQIVYLENKDGVTVWITCSVCSRSSAEYTWLSRKCGFCYVATKKDPRVRLMRDKYSGSVIKTYRW